MVCCGAELAETANESPLEGGGFAFDNLERRLLTFSAAEVVLLPTCPEYLATNATEIS
jgi:hypothetical protein